MMDYEGDLDSFEAGLSLHQQRARLRMLTIGPSSRAAAATVHAHACEASRCENSQQVEDMLQPTTFQNGLGAQSMPGELM